MNWLNYISIGNQKIFNNINTIISSIENKLVDFISLHSIER